MVYEPDPTGSLFRDAVEGNADYGVVEKREVPQGRDVLRDEVVFFYKLEQEGKEVFYRRVAFIACAIANREASEYNGRAATQRLESDALEAPSYRVEICPVETRSSAQGTQDWFGDTQSH